MSKYVGNGVGKLSATVSEASLVSMSECIGCAGNRTPAARAHATRSTEARSLSTPPAVGDDTVGGDHIGEEVNVCSQASGVR